MYVKTPYRRAIPPVRNRNDALLDATVREFGGGWNVVDNQLNLSTRFATLLDNMSRDEDGSIGVRWGTKLFSDVGTAAGMLEGEHIVNVFYHQDRVLSVLSDGRIASTNGLGVTTIVWDTTIAAGLIGAPAAWGQTVFASAAVFNGKLIVCNGTDKPLIMDFGNVPPVQYLADEATGSNVNTPICRYVIAMNKYLVMAGDPLYPDRVHISNRNTSGTWFGDPAPNDGTYVDLGKVGVQGEQTITGINRYRDQLVVGFFTASVLGKLGIYEGDVHTPDFDDVIEGFGCHSHRSMVNLGNDLFMLDDQGITSIARSLASGTIEPKRVSELIDPEINNNVNRISAEDTIINSHAVYNTNDKEYMCFVPNHTEVLRDFSEDPLEVLEDGSNRVRVRIPAHRLLVGDRVVFADLTAFNTLTTGQLNQEHVVTRVITDDIFEIEIAGVTTDPFDVLIGGGSVGTWYPRWTETYGYIYTFINELKVRAWSRYRNWKWRASCRTELGNIVFADDTRLFVLGNQNNPLYADFIGTDDEAPIEFQWEMPWADFDHRADIKHTRYMQLDTAGTAEFTMMMFVDQLYQYDGLLIPNNIITLVGGDNGGYGVGGQPYGGGRRTSDQRLYEWISRGKLFKLRFQGASTEPLRIIAITLLYQRGSIRR